MMADRWKTFQSKYGFSFFYATGVHKCLHFLHFFSLLTVCLNCQTSSIKAPTCYHTDNSLWWKCSNSRT